MKYKVSFETFIIIGIIVVAVFIGIIDYKTSYIYNVDLLIIFILSLAYKYFLHLGFFNSLKYSLGMGLIFFAIYYFTSMMGLGDVYYSFIMVFFLENLYEAFILFRDSFISAAVISIFLILSKKKSFKDSIAFGPFMSLAIIIF
ncbi:prepilin peptidase [Peptoniphilus timonensis]|uniref:prepilin peptidase n=1 Tax=Peptoniphilus timonensis TaxID=1268254 RepID=UPI001FE1D428|nr:prepilin peptidase [Peptoniphilus timonensis]